jgi:hypothetical protein
LADAMLEGMISSLQLPLPSINRLNQTKPATFLGPPCWIFFKDSVFLTFVCMHVSGTSSSSSFLLFDFFYLHGSDPFFSPSFLDYKKPKNCKDKSKVQNCQVSSMNTYNFSALYTA